MRRLLAHELVHAFDHSRGLPLHACEGLAFSEVRAAREGECKGFFPHDWLRRRCVRLQAVDSTASFHTRAQAEECVARVFEEAMADLAP